MREIAERALQAALDAGAAYADVRVQETETEELVGTLYGDGNGDASLVSRVAQRAGGNPLFAEEMVNRLQEGAEGDALPETVHSVLAARLDSLRPFERRLLQYASVVGQNFLDSSHVEFGNPATASEMARGGYVKLKWTY